MKRFFKRALSFTLILAMITMTLVSCSSDTASGRNALTKKDLEENLLEVLKSSVDMDALFPAWENPFSAMMAESKNATMNLDFDLAALTGMDMAAALDIAVDGKNGKGSGTLGISMPGLETPLDLTVYADAKKLVLASESFLGEDAYALNFDKPSAFAASFEKSALATMLGIPAGSVTALMEQYGINDAYIENASKATAAYIKNSEALEAEFEKAIFDMLTPYFGEITEETVTFGETPVEVLGLEVTVNNQYLESVLDLYVDVYKRTTQEAATWIKAIIPEALHETALAGYDESINQATISLQSSIDEILAMILIDGKETVYFEKATGLARGSHAVFSVTAGKDACEVDIWETISDNITFEGTITVPGEESMKLIGAVNCDEKGAALEMTFASEEESFDMVFAFETDKAQNAYRIYAEVAENESEPVEIFSVNGKLSYTDTMTAFSIDSVSTPDGDMPLGLSVEYHAEATVSEPKNVKDLLTLSEEDIYTLIGRISAATGSLSGLGM